MPPRARSPRRPLRPSANARSAAARPRRLRRSRARRPLPPWLVGVGAVVVVAGWSRCSWPSGPATIPTSRPPFLRPRPPSPAAARIGAPASSGRPGRPGEPLTSKAEHARTCTSGPTPTAGTSAASRVRRCRWPRSPSPPSSTSPWWSACRPAEPTLRTDGKLIVIDLPVTRHRRRRHVPAHVATPMPSASTPGTRSATSTRRSSPSSGRLVDRRPRSRSPAAACGSGAASRAAAQAGRVMV